MRIGRVQEIWRYPVKSMGWERLPSAEILSGGITGDRGWAVRDEVNGGIRGAKKLPGLMGCQARYLEPPKPERAGPVLPDGTQLTTDAPDAAARISAAIGHAVTLWPLQPADQLDHYRRGAPTHSDVPTELRAMFGLLPDEPLPDLSGMPREVFEFESPPGTYFDAFPLLVLTDASLRTLAARAPSSVIDVRRFRPNLLLATEPARDEFVEAAWEGKHLRVGDATLALTAACPRCVMTTHGFADLPKDPGIMRTLVKEAQHKLGIYARVAEPGAVALGDPVELLP